MSTVPRILLVDDDEQLTTLLAIKLRQAGYEVVAATKAEQGQSLALHNDYDLIILDIVMPHLNGLEICSKMRAEGILAPILLLSGKTDTDIIVSGLDTGADDYLTKPFNGNELLARVKALLRRHRKAFRTQLLQRYGLKLDIPSCRLWFGEENILLTEKETLLLKRLMSEAPRPVSRPILLRDVWGIGSSHASNRLDVYVRRVRAKLKTLSGHSHITTVRSGGYYFDEM